MNEKRTFWIVLTPFEYSNPYERKVWDWPDYVLFQCQVLQRLPIYFLLCWSMGFPFDTNYGYFVDFFYKDISSILNHHDEFRWCRPNLQIGMVLAACETKSINLGRLSFGIPLSWSFFQTMDDLQESTNKIKLILVPELFYTSVNTSSSGSPYMKANNKSI